MYKNIIKAVLVGSLIASCGDVVETKVYKQPESKVKLPDYHTPANGVYLTDSTSSVYYTGSLLVWDDLAKTEAIQIIGEKSTEKKYIVAELYELMVEEKQVIAEWQPLIDEQNAAIEKVRAEAIKDTQRRYDEQYVLVNSQSYLEASAKTWLEDTLKTIELSEEQKALETEKFQAYCQAKIWEMATSIDLMSLYYTKRPLPNAACESYYEKAGLLNAATGECSASAGGKRYFNCLWAQGVLKTPYFLENTASDVQKAAVTAFVNDYLNTGKFEAAFFAGDFYDHELMKNPYFFTISFTSEGNYVEAVSTVDNDQIVPMSVYSTHSVNDVLRVTDYPGEIYQLDPSLLMHANLAEASRIFGRRLQFPESSISLSDFMHNRVRLASEEEYAGNVIAIQNTDLESGLTEGARNFPALFGEEVIVKEDPKFKTQEAPHHSTINHAQSKIDEIGALISEYRTVKLINNGVESLDGVHAPNTVTALFDGRLDVELVDGIYMLTLRFRQGNDKAALVGCTDASNGVSLKCSEERIAGKEFEKFSAMEVTHDPAIGSFSIVKKVDDGAELGAQFEGEFNPAKFNRAPPEEWEGQTLEINMYPATVGAIPYLTGDLKLINGDKETRGSVNLSAFSHFAEVLNKAE